MSYWKQRYKEVRLFDQFAEDRSYGVLAREQHLRNQADILMPANISELRQWYRWKWDVGYHLEYEDKEMLEEMLFDRIAHLQASNVSPCNNCSSVNPVNNNTRQRVLEIKSDPRTSDWSLAKIAKQLNVSRVTVHKHIHKLKAQGLL